MSKLGSRMVRSCKTRLTAVLFDNSNVSLSDRGPMVGILAQQNDSR